MCYLFCDSFLCIVLEYLCEVYDEKEKFNKCNRNHFHQCTLSDKDENHNEGHKNHHGAYSENDEVLVFFSVLDKGEKERYYCESNEESRCNPMSNSFGIPVLDAVTEGKSNNTYTYERKKTEEV